MSTKAGGSDHLFLFIYENSFFLDIVFRCNIKYLFIYLLKAMSTEAGGSDDLYLLMKITCCEKCFSFLYSAVADLRGSAGDAPPLGVQTLSISCSFWEILAKSYVGAPPGDLAPPPWGNPASATVQYIFIYSKRCKQKQVEPTTFIYLYKSLVVRHAFPFNIHDLFVYLLKAM